MAVDHQDAFEAVVGQAAAHILHIADEGVPADGEGAVEIHVVRAVAVGHGRNQQGLRGNTGHGPLADLGAEPDVHIHRQVRPVVLVGGHRQHRHPILSGGLPNLVPDHFGEAVLFHGPSFRGR